MSRYTGPRLKILRALGTDLPGLSRKSMADRPHPPGQHGPRKVGARKSEFGQQLIEKQKLRFNYGLNETQLRRLVLEARRQPGTTGGKLIELLERRLDNLVFRAGFAVTIPAARQLVRHGHVRLDGRRVTIPSVCVRPGSVIRLNDKGRALDVVKAALAEPALARPEWIAFDEATGEARLTQAPDGDAAPFPLDIHRVVEFYATRI
jgi:small subunit ribosomal protein S4